MSLDVVERFFKLTLDNVYRFGCSALAAITILGYHDATSPIEGLTRLLNWLAIPSTWLTPVDEWVTERQMVVGIVAAMTLVVAIFATTNNWSSRSGATALLSIVCLIQVGQGARVFTITITVVVIFALVTGLSSLVARRLRREIPAWMQDAWEKVLNVAITLFLAACYVFSPLGWLVSQGSQNMRGTRGNPIYIDSVDQREPSGALPLRR